MKEWTDHEGVSTIEVGPFLVQLDQPRPDAGWRLICPNVIKHGDVNVGTELPRAKALALDIVEVELSLAIREINMIRQSNPRP